jgi:heme O synthase-like polyprenyltransferase
MITTTFASPALPAIGAIFVALTKPRVMTLVVFTGAAGLLAAPVPIHPVLAFTASCAWRWPRARLQRSTCGMRRTWTR